MQIQLPHTITGGVLAIASVDGKHSTNYQEDMEVFTYDMGRKEKGFTLIVSGGLAKHITVANEFGHIFALCSDLGNMSLKIDNVKLCLEGDMGIVQGYCWLQEVVPVQNTKGFFGRVYSKIKSAFGFPVRPMSVSIQREVSCV